MSTKVDPVPPGFHSFTPYLLLPQAAAAAIHFYRRAFNAVERFRIAGPKETIGHAEIVIGNSIIMLADEPGCPGPKSPATLGGTSANFVLYVEDCDATFAQAVREGATVFQP